MSTIVSHPHGPTVASRREASPGPELVANRCPFPARADGNPFEHTWKADLLIVALLAVVQLVYFTGVVASDDLGYLYCARNGAAAGNIQCPHYALRFVHWGLMALSLRLLPSGAWVMGVASMTAMATMLLVIGRLARGRMGIRRAWIPMVLFGLVPSNVILATVAMPDLTAAVLAWLGIALCCSSLLEQGQARASARCLAGGLLIAMGYNAKETVAILIPCLSLFVLLYRTRQGWAWRRMGLVGLGAGLWVVAESAFLWYWTSDPLYHSHTTAMAERGYYGATLVQPTLAGILWTHGGDYVRWLADPLSDFGLAGPLLLAGLLAIVARRRDPACGLLACLVFPGFLYLSLGSSSLSAYQPLGHHPRYLMPVLPGLALGAGLAVDWLWTRWRSGRIPLILATVGLIAASLIAPNRLVGQWYYPGLFQAGRSLIAEHAAQFSQTRLHASVETALRFDVPAEWLGGCTSPVKIAQPPVSREEWIARYGGSYLLTTQLDRNRPRKPQARRTLYGASGEALRSFPRVARREPPRDRLTAITAWLLGRECPTNPKEAVEIYRVPADSSAAAVNSLPPT